MEGGVYQCYNCGWAGFDPEILHFDESWEIVNGIWKYNPEQLHYVCPEGDCEFLFSIVLMNNK